MLSLLERYTLREKMIVGVGLVVVFLALVPHVLGIGTPILLHFGKEVLPVEDPQTLNRLAHFRV